MLADMSTKLQFEIYYGEGSIVQGPYGVTLNGFSRMFKGIDRPWDKTFGAVHSWLERGFKVNTETHMVTVQTLVTWANESVFWELMLIRNTSDWKMYMSTAIHRGWPLVMLVQILPKVVSPSEGDEHYDNTHGGMHEQQGVEEGEENADEDHGNQEEAQG